MSTGNVKGGILLGLGKGLMNSMPMHRGEVWGSTSVYKER